MCHVISIGYLKKVNTKRAQYRTIIIWLISLFSFKNYLFCEQIASCCFANTYPFVNTTLD